MAKSLHETVILVDKANNISRVIDSATAKKMLAEGRAETGSSFRNPKDIHRVTTYIYRYG